MLYFCCFGFLLFFFLFFVLFVCLFISIQKSVCITLTFTALWANSADGRMVIFFLFFPENRIYHFMRQNGDIFLVFLRKQDLTFHANCLLDNLNEISNPVCWEKYFNMLFAENFTQLVKTSVSLLMLRILSPGSEQLIQNTALALDRYPNMINDPFSPARGQAFDHQMVLLNYWHFLYVWMFFSQQISIVEWCRIFIWLKVNWCSRLVCGGEKLPISILMLE